MAVFVQSGYSGVIFFSTCMALDEDDLVCYSDFRPEGLCACCVKSFEMNGCL